MKQELQTLMWLRYWTFEPLKDLFCTIAILDFYPLIIPPLRIVATSTCAPFTHMTPSWRHWILRNPRTPWGTCRNSADDKVAERGSGQQNRYAPLRLKMVLPSLFLFPLPLPERIRPSTWSRLWYVGREESNSFERIRRASFRGRNLPGQVGFIVHEREFGNCHEMIISAWAQIFTLADESLLLVNSGHYFALFRVHPQIRLYL